VSSWSPPPPLATSAGHAGVPQEREPRNAPRSPPPPPALRRWPSSAAYPRSRALRTAWDLVGQICTPCSPGAPTKHPPGHPWIIVHPTGRGAKNPQRFRRVRTRAHPPGRIVTPPGVSRPGHSIAALAGRPWLRTSPKERSSRDFCTGTNPHR
jgi:hypothetical protein